MLHTGDGSLIVIEGMEKLFNSNTTVNFHVSYIFREENTCADKPINFGFSTQNFT